MATYAQRIGSMMAPVFLIPGISSIPTSSTAGMDRQGRESISRGRRARELWAGTPYHQTGRQDRARITTATSESII